MKHLLITHPKSNSRLFVIHTRDNEVQEIIPCSTREHQEAAFSELIKGFGIEPIEEDVTRGTFTTEDGDRIEMKEADDEIKFYLSDEAADRAGERIAEDFMLKRSTEHKDRYQTMGGTFTNQGIARRALYIILSTIRGE